jgi:hypothetical protein
MQPSRSVCDSSAVMWLTDHWGRASHTLIAFMKRVLQLVVLTLAALVAAQPVLASPGCAQLLGSTDGCGQACCAPARNAPAHHNCGAGQLTGDPEFVQSGCGQSTCGLVSVRPIPLMVVAAKSNAGRFAPPASIALPFAVSTSVPSTPPAHNALVPSTPRYVLLQVFRI